MSSEPSKTPLSRDADVPADPVETDDTGSHGEDSAAFLRQRLWISHRELQLEDRGVRLRTRSPFHTSERLIPYDTMLPDIQRATRHGQLASSALLLVVTLILPAAILAWMLPQRGLPAFGLVLGVVCVATTAFCLSRARFAGFISSLGEVYAWADIPDRETVDSFLEALQSTLQRAQEPQSDANAQADALFALWNHGLLSAEEYEALKHRLGISHQESAETHSLDGHPDDADGGDSAADEEDDAVVN